MVWAKARATVRGAESSGDRGCALVGRVLARSAGVRGAMAAGLALVMVSGVAGCARDDAVAGGSPSGSGGSATASGSGVSTPRGSGVSTPAPSEDPLFTEAKAVHLKYLDQVLRLEKSGGAQTLPDEMRALVTGQYEKDVEEAYSGLAKLGTRADEASRYRVVDVGQVPTRDGVVAIRACVDARAVILLDKSGKRAGHGTLRQDDLSFARIGNRLAISDGDSVGVDSCER